jgi:CBS domain-containing protein
MSRTVPAAYRQDACRHVVADVITRNLVTATEKLPVEEVARLFVRLPWRMLPVVGLGRLVAWSPAPTSSTRSLARTNWPARGDAGVGHAFLMKPALAAVLPPVTGGAKVAGLVPGNQPRCLCPWARPRTGEFPPTAMGRHGTAPVGAGRRA